MKKEVKYGAILSYILLILNAVYGLIIAPYMLSMIGTAEYGVYKTISSLTASVMVLDLGIGATMQRFIAKYNTEKKQEKCSNFSAMGLIQAAILGAVVAVICVVLYNTLDKAYGKSFSYEEMKLAKIIFVISAVQIVVHIFENVINGIITGYNRFVFGNSLKIILLLLRICVYYIILPILQSAVVLVSVTLIIECITIFVQLIYIRKRIGLKIKFYYFDKRIFSESIIYTMFMFVQTIVSQVNSNLDNVLIGAMVGTGAVTVYSFGITIFSMFNQLSSAMSGVMLPTITDKLYNNVSKRELENTVIDVGKIQFFLLGSCLAGFILIGKEFIELWLGKGFEDVWYITLVLMIPAIFELSVNVCLSILRAKNKLGFRTVALIVGVLINLITSIVGIKNYGYIAASYGTAISIVVSSIVMMNIYYVKIIKINILRIYYHICKTIIPILLIASGGLLAAQKCFNSVNWITLILKMLIFVMLEACCILLVYYIKRRLKIKSKC